MKKIHIYIASILLFFTGCEKVIDVDLNSVDPRIVIEAQLVEGTNDFVTKISKTGDFFGEGPTDVTDATVMLSDGTTTTPLVNNSDGTYSVPNYLSTNQTTYTLTVVADGITYEAVSTMPSKINLDTIAYDFQEASAFSDSGYFAFLIFQDPGNEANFYRGTVTVNGEFTKGTDDLYIFDDQFTNGNVVIIPVFGEVYQEGDSIDMDLYSLNEANYRYYETLSQIVSNSGGNAAPANPETNWNNDALGVFTTVSISNKKGVVLQSTI